MLKKNQSKHFSKYHLKCLFAFSIFVFALLVFSASVLWSQLTVAVIQPGNKTLKYTNSNNQPVVDIRVKHLAIPVNGDYIVRITAKSPTEATVAGYSATNIVADGSTWNELTGLAGIEIVFDHDALLAVGDEVRVRTEEGPDGKDNAVSMRGNYPSQEAYRVYSKMWTYYNNDGGHVRGLIQFDLSNLPLNTTILSADIFIIPDHSMVPKK